MFIFSIEYLLRLWSCVYVDKYRHPIFGRIKYIFSLMAIIDLIAIAPFYLTFVVTDARIIRILRILRATKHSKHTKTFKIIYSRIIFFSKFQL